MLESPEDRLKNLANKISEKEKQKFDLEKEIFQLAGSQSIGSIRIHARLREAGGSLSIKIVLMMI